MTPSSSSLLFKPWKCIGAMHIGWSESNVSCFIMLAHNVRGGCWWYGSKGWTFMLCWKTGFCSWKYSLSNSDIEFFVAGVFSVEINRRRYFWSNLHTIPILFPSPHYIYIYIFLYMFIYISYPGLLSSLLLMHCYFYCLWDCTDEGYPFQWRATNKLSCIQITI